MIKNPKVSVIIPAYNEEKSIREALKSISAQSWKNLETIVVDDGSTDTTPSIVKEFRVNFLTQNHRGPGVARNYGASKSNGEILVFVDADMTFSKDFIKDLVAPIQSGKAIGTFSKEEMVKNQDNHISICWNINRDLPKDRMISKNFPETAPVFRAILKREFEKVEGFETSGQYTDDWSLSRKLKVKSILAPGALYFHTNPQNYREVWKQARWIGKNEFISGNFLRKTRSLILYSFPVSIAVGFYKALSKENPEFVIFKIIYDLAVWCSVVASFFGETKSK